jgi:hypothetical protein
MKKLTLLFVALLFSKILFSQEDYQGDLSFCNYSNDNTNINVKIECVSVPYEGLNRLKDCNRSDILNHRLRNGAKFRINWTCNPTWVYDEWQIMKYSFNNISPNSPLVGLTHCSANVNISNGVWGYGKYKITITTSNNITYICYLNDLDSYYNDEDWMNGSYRADFVFWFNGDNATYPLELYSSAIKLRNVPAFTGGDIPEYTVWKLIKDWPNPEPINNDFQCYSTPFGFWPKQFLFNTSTINARQSASIGTGVKILGAASYTNPYDGYNTLHNTTIDYYNSPDLPENVPGSTVMTPSAIMVDENGMDFTGVHFYVEPGCLFQLMPLDNSYREHYEPTNYNNGNVSFWISSYDNNPNSSYAGDKLTMKKNSLLKLGYFEVPNGIAKLQTYKKGKFIDEGSIKELYSGSLFKAWASSEIAFVGTDEVHTINNGAKVEINGGATLRVGDNTTLKFDGTGSNLVLHNDAIVLLGTNAKIVFSNGAYCQADYANFSYSNSNGFAEGLVFEQTSGNATINHCTFNGCLNPIKMYSEMVQNEAVMSICNNVFNLQNVNSESCGIYFENNENENIQNNTFNLSTNGNVFTSGIYAKYTSGVSPEMVYIAGNTFNNGTIPLIAAGFGGSHISNCIISSNVFNGNSNINILQRMVDAEIKYNSLSPNTPYSIVGIQLTQSNPSILWNNINSYGQNIYITSASYPHLAPGTMDDQLVLVGGENVMSSQVSDNIFGSYFYAYLDNGKNRINKYSSTAYHIAGQIDLSSPYEYYMRNNCWNDINNPTSLIYYYVGEVIHYITPIWQPSTFNCSIDYSYDDISVIDKGNGIFDTLFMRNSSNLQPASDEELYTQAYNYRLNENYFDAIDNYKTLINNHISSSYLNSALSELYDCYNGLDTGSNQQDKYVLFSNLANYLDVKIQSNLYDYQFNEIAYNLYLSCNVNMENFNEALNGYEFISLYHPDLYTRLMASWDFSEVEDLMGQGGSEPEYIAKMTNEEYKDFRMKRLEKVMKPDPILNRMKKLYTNESKKHDENISKMVTRNLESSDKKEIKINEIKNKEKVINANVISNLRSIKYMTKKEKEKKQFSDMLLNVNDVTAKKTQLNNTVPVKYNLSQNYPNPFNPVTKIDYDLPRDGKVKLVIYDLLGREIKTLVNEFKTIGKYSIEFNGSSLASGVYFYRIQAGDFTQVKRMVLVK